MLEDLHALLPQDLCVWVPRHASDRDLIARGSLIVVDQPEVGVDWVCLGTTTRPEAVAAA